MRSWRTGILPVLMNRRRGRFTHQLNSGPPLVERGTLHNCYGFCYNIAMEYMDKCRHHPDRDACVLCQKMEVAYCQECLDNCKACTDPCLYCKFRPGCVIYELCRKEARKRCKENDANRE